MDKELNTACQVLLKTIGTKQIRPILQNFRIEIVNHEATIHATDLNMALKYRTSVLHENADFLINGKMFKDAIKNSNGLNDLNKNCTSAEIAGINLPLFPGDDFPEVPDRTENVESNQILEIESELLYKAISQTSFSMNKGMNRYALDSMLLNFTGTNFQAVATDQIRLAFYEAGYYSTSTVGGKFIIPAKAIYILESILKKAKGKTQIIPVNKSEIYFKIGNYTLLTRLVDTQFPKYEDAYEKYMNNPRFDVNKAELLAATDQMLLLCDKNHGSGNLILESGKLVLKMMGTAGSSAASVNIIYSGEKIVIGLTWHFLKEFLKVAETETLELIISGDKQPVILSYGNIRYFMSPRLAQ